MYTNKWLVEDFYNYYNTIDANCRLFSCIDIQQRNDIYLNVEDSIRAFQRVIYFQCNNVLNRVNEFYVTLYRTLNKMNGKHNSVWVMGDVSSGKNFIFDAVCNSLINVGYVTNPIRGYVFGFMDCVNRRILMWNEAQCDSYFYEDAKTILAGDAPKVSVKMLGPKTVLKTPVVIFSNRHTFPNDDQFNCRLTKYEWRKCNLLKDYIGKKPDPFVVPLLSMYYNNVSLLSVEYKDLIESINRDLLN